jgi:hypothetical protein
MTHAHTEIEIGTVTNPELAANILRPLSTQLRKAYGTAADLYTTDVVPMDEPYVGFRVVVRHPDLSVEELQSRILQVFSQVMAFQWKPWH